LGQIPEKRWGIHRQLTESQKTEKAQQKKPAEMASLSFWALIPDNGRRSRFDVLPLGLASFRAGRAFPMIRFFQFSTGFSHF
jgi:hypothetical protein